MLGQAPLIDPELGDDFKQLMEWADKIRNMKVRTNADTPADAAIARSYGAQGIGLCRTEHMFFAGDRIDYVRQMILGSLDYKRLERELNTLESELLKGVSPKKRKDLLEMMEFCKQNTSEKSCYQILSAAPSFVNFLEKQEIDKEFLF